MHGVDAYYSIMPNKRSHVEMDEHTKIAEFLRNAKPNTIKKPRLTKKAMEEIRSDLMTFASRKNPLSLLPAYALYYNTSIVIVFQDGEHTKASMKVSLASVEAREIVLYKRGNTITMKDMDDNIDDIFTLESCDKWLRPISAYKVDDLKKILFSLLGEDKGHLRKPEMYELLEKEIMKWI
jgi:hypothetical protein